MSVASNKKVVRLVLDDLTRERTFRCFAEHSEFEGHMVDYETSPIRRENDEQRRARRHELRSEMRRAGTALLRVYPDGNTRAIKSITAEGDRVVAEYLVHAGRTAFDPDVEHNFHVAKIFEMSRGEIVRMREYCDSAYLNTHAGPVAQIMYETTADGGGTPPPSSAWSSDWCLARPDVHLESDETATDEAQLERNKDVARGLIGAWGDESMVRYLHEDVFFNNEVDPVTSPRLSKGIVGRDRLVAAARTTVSAFSTTLSRTVTAMTAENNRVVVEEKLSGTSPLHPGIAFSMRQAKVCVLHDGRIHRIRQYLDSGYLQTRFPALVAHGVPVAL